MSNNPPYSQVNLTKELHDFLLENIDANMTLGLASMQMIRSRDNAEKLVAMLEKFKALKKALDAAELLGNEG